MRLVDVEGARQANLSPSPNGVQKLTDGISRTSHREEAFLAQIQKLVGELNLAQTSAMGRVGSVVLRPLNLIMNGGSRADE